MINNQFRNSPTKGLIDLVCVFDIATSGEATLLNWNTTAP